MTKKEKLEWRVYTSQLFKEIISNNETAIMHQPLRILLNLLGQVAKRALELDDVKLNKLMLRMSLYSISDPGDSEYDLEKTIDYILNEPEVKE
jgi:hypothetical protein